MAIYYPFAKTAERQRLANEKIAAGNSQTTVHG
jgi:hypothetical protein